MFRTWLALAMLLLIAACEPATDGDSANSQYGSMEALDGFVDLYWDADSGRLLIRVEEFGTQFLYQSSMPRGVGSNDLSLDRGQLGIRKVVSFERSGPKILLVEHNLAYRAGGDDVQEHQAVEESFAKSVIWGFAVEGVDNEATVIDATDFFLRDVHGVANRLNTKGEGSFAVDASRSAIYMPRTKAFPDNTEVEAIVTLVGQATGPYLPTVTPDSSAVTTHMHHSFIRLPDDNYEPLEYDPRAGVIGLSDRGLGFADYASKIGEPLVVNYGRRHRLEKKNPEAEVSEAVDPIVYYLDPGAPEPVRSALLDGARWWNQAFEEAGYKDGFQVELLPEGADPMDVRYNTIQWVHRSTRGWSYGYSVLDPRTGEILKGHVTLGSLRVRQDYLIIESLLAPYEGADVPDAMLEVALARIRQLSAHEVGHTIGFAHNFAASTQDRSSVMDYPFPLVTFDDDGELDFSKAYDDKIGSWDKRGVLYAYQDFPDDIDAAAARREIMDETLQLGYKYVTDADSRSVDAAHPDANLWDNGADSIVELDHLIRLRAHALEQFSENNIRPDRPMATLEEVLVPLYLLHRFQIQAVGKLIGGSYFGYTLRGDGQMSPAVVAEDRQRAAIDALLQTLQPDFLRLSPEIAALIPPRPPGHPKTRETFTGNTGGVFDELAPARSSAALTLDVLLNPERAARMSRQGSPQFSTLTNQLMALAWFDESSDAEMQRLVADQLLTKLMQLAVSPAVDPAVRGVALAEINRLDDWFAENPGHDLAVQQINNMRSDPASIETIVPVTVPPGSPIGTPGE
ncbi:MAG: zinc-dependent metalloprotease [Woeseiaceae bacterium]